MFREKKNKSWEENFLLEIREKWEKTEKIYSSVYYTYLPGIITTVRLSIKKYPTQTHGQARQVGPDKIRTVENCLVQAIGAIILCVGMYSVDLQCPFHLFLGFPRMPFFTSAESEEIS